VFFFTTDIILSILPLFIIRNIQRPLREKIVISLLMSLGFLCAVAVIPKLISLHDFGVNKDFTWTTAEVAMWSMVEVSLGIMVACIPALKRVFERTLKRFGLKSSDEGSSKRTRTHYGDDTGHIALHSGLSSRAYAEQTETRKSWMKAAGGTDNGKGSDLAKFAHSTDIVLVVDVEQKECRSV
jgi:hypothetical protein